MHHRRRRSATLWDFDKDRDGFEDDAHVQALRTEAFQLALIVSDMPGAATSGAA
jgi:hypothetical protein